MTVVSAWTKTTIMSHVCTSNETHLNTSFLGNNIIKLPGKSTPDYGLVHITNIKGQVMANEVYLVIKRFRGDVIISKV